MRILFSLAMNAKSSVNNLPIANLSSSSSMSLNNDDPEFFSYIKSLSLVGMLFVALAGVLLKKFQSTQVAVKTIKIRSELKKLQSGFIYIKKMQKLSDKNIYIKKNQDIIKKSFAREMDDYLKTKPKIGECIEMLNLLLIITSGVVYSVCSLEKRAKCPNCAIKIK